MNRHGATMRGLGVMVASAFVTAAMAKEVGKPGQRTNHQGPVKVLRGFDANKNGRIDGPEVEKLREAFAGALNSELTRYDLNGDGKLDDREISNIRLNASTVPPRSPDPGVADAPVK